MQDLIDRLHPLEKKVIKVLKDNSTLEFLEAESKLSEIEVMRAVQWLENKDILKINIKDKEIVEIDENGKVYAQKGLPEKIILKLLKTPLLVKELKEKSKLSDEEVMISIGVLKGKVAIDITNDKKFKINVNGEKLLEKDSPEERLLHKVSKNIINVEDLNDIEKFALNSLKKRKKIIRVENVRERTIKLTDLGKKVILMKISDENYLEALTPEIIRSESWKNKKFRKYDLNINVPKIYGGKKHFVNQSIEYARKIWTELGFKEMEGNLTDTSFWVFDALFTAQDHPAREMQDTFFIKRIKGKLPKIFNNVKKAHEQGVSGSKGWNYNWKESETQKIVLRTHTTSLSARTLASLKKEDLPAKYFAIGKVFRNETVDWKHAFEFYQTEGIVIDENANFRNLLGYLKEFYQKMGFEKIKFVPSFFAYTEPSVEIQVWHPEKKEWLELGGAGIFRPEVTTPLLGKPIPVLAWGQGFDRIIMDYYKIKDLREMYSNNLKLLKEKQYWMK